MNQLTKAAKTLAAKYNSTSLILRIAIGLVIGSVLALICPGAAWIEEFGNLFVGALKGVAPVLVFVIVASALAQGSSRLDRRFGTVVWLYMLTTFVAAALSVVTSKLFPQTLVLAEAATADVVPQGLGDVMHTLLSNIVSNPVASIMNGNYIGILIHYRQRYVFGGKLRHRRRRQHYLDAVALSQLRVRLADRPVHEHIALRYPLLHKRARVSAYARAKHIEPLTRCVRLHL